MDAEERLHKLESTVASLGQMVLDQTDEICELRAELREVRADASLDAELANWGVLHAGSRD